MKYGFVIYKMKVDEHVFWIAESRDLNGCVGQGDTIEEAIRELENNEVEWLDAAKEYGIDIPEPSVEQPIEYSGKFMTRVSPQVHKEAAENAAKQGISLNQYVSTAIATMNNCQTAKAFIYNELGDIFHKNRIEIRNYQRGLQYNLIASNNVYKMSITQ